ncbi:hypothetical protein BGZ94_003060 [Podila epigama]|nr:hypothetical protein BGZ94_003060 [Podila epigama]
MKSSFTAPLCLIALLASSSSSFVKAAAPSLDQCTVSLASLLSDPGLNTCLPIPSLAKLLTDPITPTLVNDTATEFCSFPDCSQTTITLVQNTVAQNCIDNTTTDRSTSDLVYGAASLYPPFKQGLCQRVPASSIGNSNSNSNSSVNVDSGTFCVTLLTESMTAYLAKNPTPLGLKIFANSTVLKEYVNAMPKDLLCTPCNKAIINPLINYVQVNQATLNEQILKWAKVIQTEVQLKCGLDFTDGAPPSSDLGSGSGKDGQGSKSGAVRLGLNGPGYVTSVVAGALMSVGVAATMLF